MDTRSPGVVTIITGGPEARRMGQLTEDGRKKAVLDAVAERFGDKAQSPVDDLEQIWAVERYSGGGMIAHTPPGVAVRERCCTSVLLDVHQSKPWPERSKRFDTVEDSCGISHAKRDVTRTIRRRRGVEPDLDLSPGLYTELLWRIGPSADPMPFLTLNLSGVAGISVDIARAGLASLDVSTINVSTDTVVQIRLAALPPDVAVLLDREPTGPTVHVPVGRHTITLTTASVPSREVVAAIFRR